MSTQTDGQLVEQCLRGLLSAFEELVERYRSDIVKLASRRIGNDADAEDVAQEAFVHAYFALPQLREPDKFAHWLRRITVRRSLLFLRDNRREESIEPSEVERLGAQDVRMPDYPMLDALSSLPEALQQVMQLIYVEGYSYQEAADMLGVPEGTVKSRLNRAKALIRKESRVMEQRAPYSAFTNEVVERLMKRARELLGQDQLEAAGEPLDQVLDIQFENGQRFDPEAVRMIESIWEEMRKRDAEANAQQYGRRLEDLDWKVARFNVLSCSFTHPGGEGQDLWGVPRESVSCMVDARDVCRRLKVSPVTLHKWMQDGMPVIRYRPWVRFDMHRIAEWLADNGIHPEPEIELAQASRPLAYLFTQIEAGRLSARQADTVFKELDLPAV